MLDRPTLVEGGGIQTPAWRNRSPAGKAVRLVAVLLLLLFLVWLLLFVTRGRFLKVPFERVASRVLDRPVRVEGDFQLFFDPLSIHFAASGLSIANPGWAGSPHVLFARRIDLRLATLPLLMGTRRIDRLRLDGSRIDLEWDERGQRNNWTFGDPGTPPAPYDLPRIRRALITGTVLHYRDPRVRFVVDVVIDTIAARRNRLADEIRFDGTGLLHARPFRLSGSLLSPNETVAGGNNRFLLHAAGADTRLGVAGTLPGATEIEGGVLAVAARGDNLARLFDFIGIVVPDTRAYHLVAQVRKEGEAWHFTRLKGRFGQSDLRGRLTIVMRERRPRLEARLASSMVDIVDLGPFIGYRPGAAPVRRVAGRPRVLPDAPLRIAALAGFDAHLDYAVRHIRAPSLPVSDVRLRLELDHGVLRLSPLRFDMARGHVVSDIVIDSRARPVATDYDIRLAPTPLGRLLAGWGVEQSGTTGTLGARVRLKGRGDSVHRSLARANGRIALVLPRGTLWTRNAQLSELDIGTFVTKMFAHKLETPVQINCGLIAFTVREGRAMADPILIDTSRNVLTGRGGFDFADEALALKLRADAKTFSLFSGQSPVGVGGYFAAPRLDVISPELLTRAGVGIGLGVAATPLAAILAFIDPGDAKAAACGPVLAGATASAQRTRKGRPRTDVR